MKKLRFVALSLALTGALLGAQPAYAANLLANPGFESGALSPWSCTGGLGSVVSTPVHGGTKALAGAASASDHAQCTQTVTVQPNTAYTLSAWVRGSYVYLGITGGASTWTPSATAYTQLTVNFTTGASQTSAQVFLHGWYGQGTYYADDVSLDGPGGTNPGGPATPTGLAVTGTTSSSISLGWTAVTGATGYRVYEGTTLRATVTGTSTTISGLGTCTSHSYSVAAYNATGESAASGAVSASTSGCPTAPGLPTAPYVDMGAWPTPALPDLATGGNLKSFTMAFITASACKAMWFNAYDPRQGWARDQIDTIRARGGDVKISFGGATGIELAQACTSVSALQAEYQAVVTAYALKYIDLDIEGSATAEPASVARRSQALAALQAANPGLKISLTLPVLPEGLTADGLGVVRSARDAGVNLDLVNIMAMDYYRTGDYGDLAVQAANSTFAQLKTLYPAKTDAQLWKMVGVTPMLGQNDDGHVYNQADARQMVTFAQSKHLGMLAFWETTRDRNACTGALYMCTNIAQTPYEFSKIFAGYTG
ncbi:carbohydrate binding domain-containing protein [Catellatospora tritici]|uniref:carbohydrate binding domain-containing protein n=1 Tax=Catellatospora tritici TaxID=2851566 RepID=UPI001C2DA166|nr:carbohydrate binding domain-containing protein [Catellatospora tritici]MBV1856742.1 carbohydrate binding domain-containing protein [Catellatospora tritici]